MIRNLLVADPEKRLTPDQFLAHRWITGSNANTENNTLEKMREWHSNRKLNVK